MHDKSIQIWVNQNLLDSIKNGSWSIMDAPILNRGQANSIWGSTNYWIEDLCLNWLLNRLLNQFSEPVWFRGSILNRSAYCCWVSFQQKWNQKGSFCSDHQKMGFDPYLNGWITNMKAGSPSMQQVWKTWKKSVEKMAFSAILQQKGRSISKTDFWWLAQSLEL